MAKSLNSRHLAAAPQPKEFDMARNRPVRVRFTTLWRNKFLTTEATTIQGMANALNGAPGTPNGAPGFDDSRAITVHNGLRATIHLNRIVPARSKPLGDSGLQCCARRSHRPTYRPTRKHAGIVRGTAWSSAALPLPIR